jgi:hypothetical protein
MVCAAKEYRLIEALTVEELNAKVNALLQLPCQSWQLLGTTFFANAGYRQAMVRA